MPPTPELIERAVARGCVRLVTVAPERAGALALIARLRAQGVTVSLGHTDATAAELCAGIDAGASMVTHLYNAMSPFSHRAPGAVGAALTDDRVVAGLIADGVHVDPVAAEAGAGREGLQRPGAGHRRDRGGGPRRPAATSWAGSRSSPMERSRASRPTRRRSRARC